jgi:hypothetical protein
MRLARELMIGAGCEPRAVRDHSAIVPAGRTRNFFNDFGTAQSSLAT